jgi:hypothetical protein
LRLNNHAHHHATSEPMAGGLMRFAAGARWRSTLAGCLNLM